MKAGKTERVAYEATRFAALLVSFLLQCLLLGGVVQLFEGKSSLPPEFYPVFLSVLAALFLAATMNRDWLLKHLPWLPAAGILVGYLAGVISYNAVEAATGGGASSYLAYLRMLHERSAPLALSKLLKTPLVLLSPVHGLFLFSIFWGLVRLRRVGSGDSEVRA